MRLSAFFGVTFTSHVESFAFNAGPTGTPKLFEFSKILVTLITGGTTFIFTLSRTAVCAPECTWSATSLIAFPAFV